MQHVVAAALPHISADATPAAAAGGQNLSAPGAQAFSVHNQKKIAGKYNISTEGNRKHRMVLAGT
jgi:hypothetical protein